MSSINSLLLSGLGIVAGCLFAIQSVLNASLGQRLGYLGSVLVLTVISMAVLIALIIVFPSTKDFNRFPGLSEWYLYFGGVIGIAIMVAPIYIVPRIGTTATLIAIVLGQSLLELVIDHFGLFASPKIEFSSVRMIGVLLVAIGVYLVGK